MKKALLEMLICPACLPDENGLREVTGIEQGDDIIEGSLACRQCGRNYPIREGIAFLNPASDKGRGNAESKYETALVLSSYMWSHYGDILGEENASDAYSRWADLMQPHSGISVDAGSAVGRFTFEMTGKCDFAIGVDNSVSFIWSARELMRKRRMKVALQQEGALVREVNIRLREEWNSDKVEFIVGDALALPFKSKTVSSFASLNLIDKVPVPLQHLKEMNRVVREKDSQFLFSDPFSWSMDVARVEDWLGGKNNGAYSGAGVENIMALLKGDQNVLMPEWGIERHGHIWWKIRTHANHFELIKSCFVKASR